MTEQQRVRPLVEGAFLAVITALMGVLAINLLPVKFLVDFMWGLPLIVIVMRYDLRTGFLTLATTFFITWLLAGPVLTLLLFIELAPLALLFAVMFKRDKSPGTVLVAGIAVSLISDVLTILGYLYLANITILPTEQALQMQAKQFMEFYVKIGMDAGRARQMVEDAVRLAQVLIPSTLAVTAVARAFLTYFVAVRVLRRLNHSVKSLPPFSEWRLPWYFVWVFILGLIMTLAGDHYQYEVLAGIGKNVVFAVAPLFFVTGLSLLVYYFKNINIPTWTKTLLGIVAVVNFTGTVVLCIIIGLFDPLVSFRNWKKPAE